MRRLAPRAEITVCTAAEEDTAALLGVKTTRTTQGVALLTLKKKYTLDAVRFPEETGITDLARYRGRSIPATGALLKTEDSDDKQLSLI